jgi:hypothetical protein
MRLVRNLVNDNILFGNREKLGFVWDMTCASMDMIDDSQFAIDSFGDRPTNEGQRYLEVYGLFQAFFLQQDALMNLCAGLNLGKIETFNTYFGSIRDLRNKYFGHPTKHDRPAPTTYHGLSRMTVNGAQITAWTYPNFSTEIIDIADAVKQQEQGALTALGELYRKLVDKRKEYAMTFHGQPLSTDHHSYEFEKLGVWALDPDDSRDALAVISLDIIHDELVKIEDGITRRYDDTGGDVMRPIEKAWFCIGHLRNAMTRQVDNKFEKEIYVDVLRQTYGEIIETCVAINEDFSVNSQVEGWQSDDCDDTTDHDE